jgi:arabinose-5-phosphate isomerase
MRKSDADEGRARASAARSIETEIAGLERLKGALADELGDAFSAAVTLIGGISGRVIVTGMGKSGHVGRKIASTFASTGTPAHFVHPGEASHGDLGMIRSEDVILALSWSGETAELADIIGYSRRFRVGLVAITSNPASTLGEKADVALVLPKAEEACPNGLAPTTSTTMQIALGDALAVALLERRDFSRDDFRTFHPGGKLGAQLKTLREIMHRGGTIPVIADDVTMAEAVAEISAKGFGCTLVVRADGTLAGIVTDGDLRRHLTPDLMRLPVGRVMTRNPKVVRPDMLLGAAVEFQERHKITVLIVVEGEKPVGLVHYLDLLRAGAA